MRAGVLVLACAAACQSRVPAAPPPPEQEVRLLRARDREDVDAMRAHGWELFARVQPAWRAWASSDVALGAPDRRFRALQPFRVGDRVEVETLPVMFEVVLDPAAVAHIRRYGLAAKARLRAHGGRIPEFPREAIAAKLVWYPIKRDRPTTLPIWDGEPSRDDGNPGRTWRRTVVVDGPGTGRGLPLDAFLTRRLVTEDEAAAARAAARDPEIAAGDTVVLVAMHLATKEIPDWVWATYWWHDHPTDGTFAAGRPRALTGAAGNYLMDVAFSATSPRRSDGSPHACMNPWLEARFPNGVHSNCLACHRRAALGAADYLPVTRGDLSLDDPYFTNKVTTDFVWSLALESR
ncbi:MAG: hypothetical protein KF773_11820 [Deltaproteobacteria bacterium]|nr:hypothetical protein [Deltaproteobacteria bacterium]